MFDIVALGELLIDFTSRGNSENGSLIFEANPGGAPCNVLSVMTKLGKKTAFIGKVGNDAFGSLLKETLEKLKIDTAQLKITDEHFTTLAFVTLDDDGNRSFSFSRKNSADVMLSPDDIDEKTIKNSKIFHCGTLSLTNSISKDATIKALDIARRENVIISVDPNLRMPLWNTTNDAKNAMDTVLRYADIIKISDYEVEFLLGETDMKNGARMMFEKYSPKVVFVTCGKNGAYMTCGGEVFHYPCYSDVKTVDTTGEGDCFMGSALSELLDYGIDFENLSEDCCIDILRYANAAASLATTKYGSLMIMPNNDEIEGLINGSMQNRRI